MDEDDVYAPMFDLEEGEGEGEEESKSAS